MKKMVSLKKDFDQQRGDRKKFSKESKEKSDIDAESKEQMKQIESSSPMGSAIGYFVLTLRLYFWQNLSKGAKRFIIVWVFFLGFLFSGGDGIILKVIDKLMPSATTLKIEIQKLRNRFLTDKLIVESEVGLCELYWQNW